MKFLKYISLFSVIVVLSGCAKTTMIRSAPGHQDIFSKSKNMVLLPPIVEVNEVDVGGKLVRQHNYEYHLEDIIKDILVQKLQTKGYKIKPITKKAIHDLKLSRKVLTLQEEYQEQINPLYTPWLWDEKKAFAINVSLKKGVLELQNNSTDLIVFVEYSGRNKTSGASAKDVAVAVLLGTVGYSDYSKDPLEDASEYVVLRLAIIDAKNYNILWANVVREGYSMFRSAFDNMSSIDKVERKRLNELFDTMLKDLPSRN